jgi:hypothetical protein
MSHLNLSPEVNDASPREKTHRDRRMNSESLEIRSLRDECFVRKLPNETTEMSYSTRRWL